MPVSPVNSASLAFRGNRAPKKKVKTKNVLRTALALSVAASAVAYATQKGKGGAVDMIIAELQPMKKAALKFLSQIFHKISP